jgi:hypothetical protein
MAITPVLFPAPSRDIILPTLSAGFQLWRFLDDIAPCEFIALVNQFVKVLLWDAVPLEDVVQHIGNEDSCLLCRKRNPHEKKDDAVAKTSELFPDDLLEHRLQQAVVLAVDVLADDCLKEGCANP